MALYSLLVPCEPGLASLLLAELHGLGYHGKIVNHKSVRVTDVVDDDVVRLNYVLRQATGVYLILWEGRVHTLDDIREVAREPDYIPWLCPDQSFYVEGDRSGDHNFRAYQMGGAIGQAIVNQFRARKGVRVSANLNDPDVCFHAQLCDDYLVISVNTSGENLRKRHPRPYQHRSSLRPTIAAAMLSLSSFGKGKAVLDPMAGGGTLPTEACLMQKGMLAGAFREAYAFEKLVHLDTGSFADLKAQTFESDMGDEVLIGACDRSVKALRGMQENFRAQGLEQDIMAWEDDAERLEKVKEGMFQIMISNPSYGIWNGSARLARQTYSRVPKVAVEKGIEEMVMVTPEADYLIASAEDAGYRVTDLIPFLHGDLENKMFRLIIGSLSK